MRCVDLSSHCDFEDTGRLLKKNKDKNAGYL